MMKFKFPKIKKNYRKEIFKINTDIYWKIIVGLFFLMLIFSFIFAYSLFKNINKEEENILESSNNRIEKEKKEKINRVLDYFTEREKKSTEILNSGSPVTDPSI